MLDKNCFQLKKHNETKNVLKRLKRSTCVCEVYVQWNDGTKYWVKMKDIKASHPLKLEKYDIK